MDAGVFLRFLTLTGILFLAQGVAVDSHASSSSPESRYESYRKSLDSGKNGEPPSTIYNRSDKNSSYGKPAPKILNLKQILNSDPKPKYGMQTRSSTPPVPYGAGPKGPKPPPTAAEMQEMARMDRERTVRQSVADSEARMARVRAMQAELYGKPATLPSNSGWNRSTSRSQSAGQAGAPPVRYTYRKTDPTKVEAPRRVFSSNR
ncbi:MAG: hypothetical protein H6862_06130 [Rhodospirillales bacterium]|nr:hypothetical protein [Rhodospirillales bacterium]